MKLLLVLIMVSGALLAQTPTRHLSGEIKGTVFDSSGSPVSAATVYAVPQGLVLDDATPRSAKTDSNGGFDFRGGLDLGSCKLYSRKDATAISVRWTLSTVMAKAPWKWRSRRNIPLPS